MRRPSSGVVEKSEGELLRAAVQRGNEEAARSAVGQMATPAVDRTQVQSESGDGSAAAAAAPLPDAVHVDVPAPAGEATPGAPPALTGRRRVSLRV